MRGKTILAVLIPLALLVSLVAWAFASPVGSSPDDDYHMASIWCGQGIRTGICEAGTGATSREVPKRIVDESSCFAFHPEKPDSCAEPASSVLTLTKRGNFDGNYPPVFYGTMSLFVSSDIDASILTMRIVNSVLFVGILTLLFFLLPIRRRGPLIWSAAITFVPLSAFLVASVNPSSWAILSAATLWAALLGFYEAETRRRRIVFGVLSVVLTVMAGGARADAAVYSVIAMVIVAILVFRRTREFALLSILPVALALVSVILFFLAGQASVIGATSSAPSSSEAPGTTVLSLLVDNVALLPGLWAGALGATGLGWLDTAMPALVWVPALAVFCIIVFWGLTRMDRRKAIGVAIVFGALVLVPLFVLVHDRVLVGAGVQPRYILPLMILLAAIALLGFESTGFGLSRVQLIVVAVCLIAANGVALQVNIRRYVTGIKVNGLDLAAHDKWWWPISVSPNAIWLLGTLAFAIVMVGLVLYTRPLRSLPLEVAEPATIYS